MKGEPAPAVIVRLNVIKQNAGGGDSQHVKPGRLPRKASFEEEFGSFRLDKRRMQLQLKKLLKASSREGNQAYALVS